MHAAALIARGDRSRNIQSTSSQFGKQAQLGESTCALGATPQIAIAHHACDRTAAAKMTQHPRTMGRLHNGDATTATAVESRRIAGTPIFRLKPVRRKFGLCDEAGIEQNRAVAR